jgi:hypothetical protein
MSELQHIIDHKKHVFLIQVESRLEAYGKYDKADSGYLITMTMMLQIISQIKENKKYTNTERILLNLVGNFHSEWDVNVHDYIKEVCGAYTIWETQNNE